MARAALELLALIVTIGAGTVGLYRAYKGARLRRKEAKKNATRYGDQGGQE